MEDMYEILVMKCRIRADKNSSLHDTRVKAINKARGNTGRASENQAHQNEATISNG